MTKEETILAKILIRIISLTLLLLTFVQIFNFSSQNGDESGSLSREVVRKAIDIFPYTKNFSEETKTEIVEKAQPIVRKLAHFSIYTLVGIFIMSFMSTYTIHLKYKFLVSILVGLIYAISDEYHQSFTPGRTPSIIDVGIDTYGVILGIIIVMIVISVLKALTKNKNVEFCDEK
jgi:VanZ family protein